MRALPALLLLSLAAQEPLPLSLDKAVELALAPDGNTRARLAAALVEQADSRTRLAVGALRPNIETAVGAQSITRNLTTFGFQLATPIPGFRIPDIAGPVSVYDARASATQSVFNLSAIRRYQAARSGAKAAREELEATRDQAAAAVARAYTATLRSQTVLETAKANLLLAERLVRLAQSQKSAGSGTGIDVVRAEVLRSAEQQRLLQANEDLDAARLQLVRVIGLNMNVQVQLTGKLEFRPAGLTPLDQALAAARKQRAEWRAAEVRIRAAQQTYDAARAERLPTVTAFGDYGTTGTALDHTVPTRTVGVQVRLPISGAGRRDALRDETRALLHQEEIRARDTRQQVELEVRLALDALRSAESQVGVAAESVQLSEKELAQAERRYQAGVAPSLEITDAQTRVARSREAHVTAIARHRLARIDLAAATGAIEELLAER